MQGDKGLAEATSCWYGDMGNVVIKCNHPGAKVMVLARTVVWPGCGIAPVDYGVQDHVYVAWAVAKHGKQFSCV